MDSGSSHQALSRAFADQNGLVAQPVGTGRDHAGQAVAVARAEPATWEIGGQAWRDEETVIVPTPPAFAPLGIIGFLSPQHCLKRGYVVLDFPGQRLRLVEAPDRPALAAWLQQEYAGSSALDLPRVTGPSARKIYVQARLAGQPAVEAELDTGGSRTEFDASLLPAVTAQAPTSQGVAVSGASTAAPLHANQTVQVGGHAFAGLQVKARQPGAAPRALLGADLLRQTVLVLPADPAEPLILLPASPGA